MHFQSTYFAENIPELHRAYRSARRSGKPIALLVTGWDHRYDESDIYRDTIRYFTERGEDISDHVYYPERGCCEVYTQALRKERTCVVVDAMIRVEGQKISRFSVRNLETTRDLVHDFVTCIPTKDRWALPEIREFLDRTGFCVVLFEFQRSPGQDLGETGMWDAFGETAGTAGREVEMQVVHCILSDSTNRYVGDFDVPVYLNGERVYVFHESCDYPDKKALLCPGCLCAVTFGRDEDAHTFVRAWPVQVFDELKGVSTIRGFGHHAQRCRSPFSGDGISRVETDRQQYAVRQLARLSKRDARWDFALVDDGFFEGGAGTAYVDVVDGVPVSYVAFRRQEIPGAGPAHVIWDLFTLPSYRGRGHATSILDHGIEELGIDRERLPVSLPVTEYSRNIIRNASTKYIMGRGGGLFDRETWEPVDAGGRGDGTGGPEANS
ncbi:MAG: GNAT family N-acetyltransferase [Methanospirillum sp.]